MTNDFMRGHFIARHDPNSELRILVVFLDTQNFQIYVYTAITRAICLLPNFIRRNDRPDNREFVTRVFFNGDDGFKLKKKQKHNKTKASQRVL